MELVRMGVIGLGSIGGRHVGYINSLQGVRLAGVCDADATRAQKLGEEHQVPHFSTYDGLITSGAVDAVIVATPHFQHPQIAVAALEAGLHVLCEKPLAVTVKQARRVNEVAALHPRQKFSLMLQQRTWPAYAELKKRLASGSFGQITRVSWIITDWFRTDAYYASGGWRATWDGEGGGVLLNQCPHNLDLLWWLTGMNPSRITAVARIGAAHAIEVEDEVSAILEYDNNAIGHFMTATGEAPGSNRLEFATDWGLITAEPSRLTIRRTEQDVARLRQTGAANARGTKTTDEVVQFPPEPRDAHKLITQNFANAILRDEPLIAPGEDGVHSLQIGNAMLMAGLTRKPVTLPLDGNVYERFLAGMIAKYPSFNEGAQNPDVAHAAAGLRPLYPSGSPKPRKPRAA